MIANLFFSVQKTAFRQKWVFVTALLILLYFWSAFQHTARQGVSRSLAEQGASNAVLLHALEDTVVRSFQSVNSALQILSESLSSQNLALESTHLLDEQLRTFPQLRSIELLNASGTVVSSPTAPAGIQADYSCIGMLQEQPWTEFVLETPRQGRYPQDPFAARSAHAYIPFCVPVRDGQGQLSQILVAFINPEYFYNLFTSITEPLGSYIHLYRSDGKKLLTSGVIEPSPQAIVEQVNEKSWGQFRTAIAEHDYLISYRSTSILPLTLVLVSDDKLALAAWRHDEALMRLFLLVMSVITLVAALVIAILREKRRQALGDIHLLSSAIRSTANAIFITNKSGDIYWINNAFTILTGYSFDEVKGKNPRLLNSGYQSTEFYKELWHTVLSGESWRGEVINRHKHGHHLTVEQTITPILDKKSNVEHFIAVHEDVTARRHAEQKALYLADHDSLTGLPNRRYFERQLQQSFSQVKSTTLAVVFIDLDRFKDINDTLGHAAGDALLVHTTANLQGLMSDNFLLARLGGDEFAVLIKEVRDKQQLTAFVSQLVAVVTKSFYYGESVFNVTCSAGVAVSHNQASDAADMLRQADMAMYRAKHEGRNTFRFFDQTMDGLIKRRVYLQQQIEVALQSDTGFSLRFQPQIDTQTRQYAGAEALMRWEITPGVWVAPDEFITLAEDTGQILDIGIWLMKNLFLQMARWQRQGVAFGNISMNISAVQLAREPLAERMLTMMQEYGIAPHQLSVEITETTLMTNSDKVTENLKRLKQAGVSLSIDDFGTGYSSMSYLKAINADQLKIDRSFIIGIGGEGFDEHIVRATIALAHSLNLKTVAEGVGSAEQLAFLSKLECDYIQGYWFAKPLTAHELAAFIVKSAP